MSRSLLNSLPLGLRYVRCVRYAGQCDGSWARVRVWGPRGMAASCSSPSARHVCGFCEEVRLRLAGRLVSLLV